jgi:hypothetical protein
MTEKERNVVDDPRAHGLARLAVLQRLREQAKQGHRAAMLHSIELLIEQESKALMPARDPNGGSERQR